MTLLEKLERKCAFALRKCDEAAASDKPWALRNLRLWQNKYSQWLADYYRLKRALEGKS